MKFLIYYEKMFKQLLLIIALFSVLIKTMAITPDSCYVLNLELRNHCMQHTVLACYYGNKIKLKDTILLDSNGIASYSGIHHEGIYFLRFIDSSFFEFMITGCGNIDILVEGDKINARGNSGTEAFDWYLKLTEKKIHTIDSLKKSIEPIEDPSKIRFTQHKIAELKSDIDKYMEELAISYEGNLLGSYAKALLPVQHILSDSDLSTQNLDSTGLIVRIYAYRNHYFDNINFNDPALIYTPVLEDRITNYLDHMVYNSADSICRAVDLLMTKSAQIPIAQFISTILLQKYRDQKQQDPGGKVYSYILQNYFLSGKTPWVSDKDLRLLSEEFHKMNLVSVGTIAPEIELPDIIGRKCSLHSVEMKFTILFFWDLECPTCKQVMTDFKDLMRKYYYVEAQVYTVYTGTDREAWKTWNIKRLPATWINTYQSPLQQVSSIYDIKTVPAIFLLDSNKTIISKNITIPELDDFFSRM
jgi:peroxiredoxin